MKRKDVIREVATGKVGARLCLTLIVNELKISVEHCRVITTKCYQTLNIIYCVVLSYFCQDLSLDV
jgi:hypothetical protein